MPYKRQGSKMLMFDRQVRGVGRIQCSSGTDKAVEFGRRNGILTKLIEGGHLETLRLFKQGTISIEALVDADRKGTLKHLSEDVLTYSELLPAVDEWALEHPVKPKTADDYKREIYNLVGRAQELKLLPSNATIADLERLNWSRLHKNWGDTQYYWNKSKTALGVFLGSAKNKGLAEFRRRVIPKIPNGSEEARIQPVLTPEKFWELVEKMYEPGRPALVAMAFLGTGPKEYFGISRADLDPDNFTVEIRGTQDRAKVDVKRPKRHRRVSVDPRVWDWIDKAVPTPLKYKWLRIHFLRAREDAGLDPKPGQTPITLYTLRHLSGQAASKSGAELQEIAQHMGHTQLSTTMGYLEGPLAEAAARAIADTLLGAAPSAIG